MNLPSVWFKVNAELVAKSIGELAFEQVLTLEATAEGHKLVTKSQVVYEFQGSMGVWGYLKVKPESLKRNGQTDFEASQFFLDIQTETGMDDIILANFFEEMHNTLLADRELKIRSQNLQVAELAQWDGEKLQSILNGHPKILLSKGRVGWSASQREQYSPESNQTFQLFWLAISKGLLSRPLEASLLNECFDESALISFYQELNSQDLFLEQYDLLPVHPWQYDRYIATQFVGEISKGEIIPLGAFGDFYRPQTSLRTLSNESRPEKMDVKLPLSVLNTSCVRGLPARYVEIGESLSQRMEEVCLSDKNLRQVQILKEHGGMVLKHDAYNKIKNAPYRYHELLGGLWRESAISKLQPGEKAILSAALFHQDAEGKSLAAEYIRRSGKSKTEWLTAFFEVTLLPLLHLQTHYGVGLVAHGQNIVLILKNDFPSGMILKDFHGDLRLSTELPAAGAKAFDEFKPVLTSLPPHYLIHDLITGNLISVQRFISLALEESKVLGEKEYYQLMYQVLKDAPGAENLLKDNFERLLLNKVRFKIGYADSDERPLPMLGPALNNPIASFKRDRL